MLKKKKIDYSKMVLPESLGSLNLQNDGSYQIQNMNVYKMNNLE